MFADDDLHPDGCDCLACAIQLETKRQLDAGLLADWQVSDHLIEVLANHIATHVNVAECLRTVDLYGNQLRAAVCRQHPQLGATIISLNDPRTASGLAERFEEPAETEAPAALQGGSLSPGPSRSLGRTPLCEVPALATPPEFPGTGNVTRLRFSERRGGRQAGDQIAGDAITRPTVITTVATATMTPEMLSTLLVPDLHQLWWACQAWRDLPPRPNDLVHELHARRIRVATLNQLRLEAALERRGQPVPMPPTPAYLAWTRLVQPAEDA